MVTFEVKITVAPWQTGLADGEMLIATGRTDSTVTFMTVGIAAPVYVTLTVWLPGAFHETWIELVPDPDEMVPPAERVQR